MIDSSMIRRLIIQLGLDEWPPDVKARIEKFAKVVISRTIEGCAERLEAFSAECHENRDDRIEEAFTWAAVMLREMK